MGNSLGISRRPRQDEVTVDYESAADMENRSGVGLGIENPKTPEPSPADPSQWKTPEGIAGANTIKSQITALIDPRSPNADISRTPIIVPGEETDLKKKMNNRFLKVNQAMNQVSMEGGSEFTTPVGNLDTSPAFDPRSPTQDFDRTPVVAGGSKKDPFRIKPSKFNVNLHSQED